MSAIYEPKGKAGEYSPLAANLYRGCSHGCTYCYAPAATFTPRDVFTDQVAPRKNILNQLRVDARKFRGDCRQVLLSFTSDPYQPAESTCLLTRQALEIMLSEELRVTILTKGGLLACRDFDLLATSKHAEFAVTLTTDNPEESLLWEPGAALPADRIESLRRAKALGIRTWVSFEPVYNPEAVYRLINATAPFVDLYKVGKMNYHPAAKSIDWRVFRDTAIALLEEADKPYLIKKDLLNI